LSEVPILDVAKRSNDVKATVFVVGPSPLTKQVLDAFTSGIEVIEKVPNIELLLDLIEPPPNVVLCTVPENVADAFEISQLLSSQYIGVPIVLLADKSTKLNRKILLKNGFSDVYFFPTDQTIFVEFFEDLVDKSRKLGKVYRPIKLIDVASDEILPFDTFLYLSANNKYIRYSGAGDSLPAERAEKLKKHEVGTLHVSGNELKKFYDYSALKLKDLQGNAGLSETEKAEKMKTAVRDLFGNMFSESTDSTETGKGLVSESQKIIKSFILAATGKSAYERILAIAANSSDFYTHNSNVSSYASLFALSLGLSSVSEIAMAALLHDLGLSKIPDDILAKDPEARSPPEVAIYEKHVDYSLDVIREKKLILSDLTRKIVNQHHEKYNGMGYPKRLAGDRICIEAQLLSLADRFDYLTVLKPGRPRLNPRSAIEQILNECGVPTKMDFDPKLVKKVLALF
jgi:HD-GYP domain-containing protein (c-di-GMP phosphodiesterase class II)